MILSCSVSSEKLTVSLSSAEPSVTWCPRCSTLWSPLFSCWSVLPTGAPLLCILWFNRAQRLSFVRSRESVLTELTCADIWPLQEGRSTKWWLLIPRPAAVRASTAPRTVTLRWASRKTLASHVHRRNRFPSVTETFFFVSQKFNSSNYPSCSSASCIFIKYNDEGLFQRNLFNLQIYNVIAFLWCANFVIALGQCTLAGAFASYYWAFVKPGDIPMFPVCASFMRAIRWGNGLLVLFTVEHKKHHVKTKKLYFFFGGVGGVR